MLPQLAQRRKSRNQSFSETKVVSLLQVGQKPLHEK
jgi:hypothetical protein